MPNPQAFENGEIHGWYNFVLGFSDKLVAEMMDRLEIEDDQLVFDPFCGTGTTLVESMKRGIASVGLDASPFSCFVSRVKTNRSLDPERLLSALTDVAVEYDRECSSRAEHTNTQTYKYLQQSGMLDRGWISPVPLRSALALKAAIFRAAPSKAYREVLLLALVAQLSTKIGNMKYGPEIYCGPRKRSVDVWSIFKSNVSRILKDLWIAQRAELGEAKVIFGDARSCAALLRKNGIRRVHVAISSPPYPTEHDYTRNTRLELAFLDFISSNDSVQSIKRSMIRSHTKGIYVNDSDAQHVSRNRKINALAARVEARCKGMTSGFARRYPVVIREYFGGMRRHFESMAGLLPSGGRYAVVVGDQASYAGTHVATASLLADIADQCGFSVDDTFVWRKRRSTVSNKFIKEHALILKRRTR